MPRKVSLKNPICVCCKTNRCKDKRCILCESCKEFIHHKLKINQNYISHIISHTDMNIGVEYRRYRDKNCSFCNNDGVIVYRHIKNKKKYLLCQAHHDKWLRIGCELGELANVIDRHTG
jgi:hypothetical protein